MIEIQLSKEPVLFPILSPVFRSDWSDALKLPKFDLKSLPEFHCGVGAQGTSENKNQAFSINTHQNMILFLKYEGFKSELMLFGSLILKICAQSTFQEKNKSKEV